MAEIREQHDERVVVPSARRYKLRMLIQLLVPMDV